MSLARVYVRVREGDNEDLIVCTCACVRVKMRAQEKKCHALSPMALAIFIAYRSRMTPRVI